MIGKMFKTTNHTRFQYRPRYYDSAQEERNKILDNATKAKQGEKDAVKERIARRLNTYSNRKVSYQGNVLKSNIMLLTIVIVIALVVYGMVNIIPMVME